MTKLFAEAIAKFRTLKKNAHLILMQSLERAVWNWMDTYPHEFTDLQKNTNEELTKCCDTFFDLLDNFAETKKLFFLILVREAIAKHFLLYFIYHIKIPI